MPPDLKAFLINLFSKNTGSIARAVAGIVAAGIAALAVKLFGYTLSAEEYLKLTGMVAGGAMWFLGEVVKYIENKNITALQAAVQTIAPEVLTDGHIGPVTVAAVERAAETLSAFKAAGAGGTADERATAATVVAAMKPPAL